MAKHRLHCTCCPYGAFASTIPIAFAFISVGLIFVASFSCNYFMITDVFEQDDSQKTSAELTFDIGLWRVESVESTGGWNARCDSWNRHSVLGQEEFDTAMVFARAVSMSAIWLGTLIGFILVGASCCTYPIRLLKWTSILCFIGGAFSLLTLIALSSKFCTEAEACELRFSGILAIGASFAWTLTGVIISLALKNKALSVAEEPRNAGTRQQSDHESENSEAKDDDSDHFSQDGGS